MGSSKGGIGSVFTYNIAKGLFVCLKNNLLALRLVEVLVSTPIPGQ